MRMSPDTDKSIRCTVSSCSCVCFKPGSDQLRSCDHCGHGWVAHALEKLQVQPQSSCGPVEVALPGLVLDLSSLVLYGAQAVPVRLKILLDRLYSILSPEQVGHILQSLGWSLGDYVRGYMLQRPGAGKVLDHWLMVTPDEELLILKQFLRFGETRPIVQLMALQSSEADPELDSCPSNTGPRVMLGDPAADPHPGARVCHFEEHSPADPVPHLDTCPAGLSVLLPVHFSSSSLHSLVSPSKEFVPSSKLFPCLRRPAGTKLCDRLRHGGRRQEVTEEETPVKIKADPDRTNPPRSLWQEAPLFYHRGASSQDSSSSSSLLCQPSSSSSSPHPKTTRKVHGSPSSFLHPLPSFSSFLCPLPSSSSSSSFSSSLRPLGPSSSSAFPPSSTLCSLPSPAGGRKGRVCCGVCGKSFYDKGTLKIHYNAVHLKIKHRCTVTGCTMVFSSLRSRNRHSANPNPRLHTAGGGGGRDSQQHRHTHQVRPEAAVWQQVDHTAGCHSNADALTHSPPSPHPVWSHDPTAGLPLPPPPPPLHAASSPCSPPSFSPPAFPDADENKRSRHHTMTTCDCDGESPANQQCRWTSADTLSKKKPRKSSMPVKIEREERRSEEEEED